MANFGLDDPIDSGGGTDVTFGLDDPVAPTPDPQKAYDTLNNGIMFNATPEDLKVLELMPEQDKEFQTAKIFYDQKYGTNHTPEMVKSQMSFEYGKDATPQVVNQMNKKAAKWHKATPLDVAGTVAKSVGDTVRNMLGDLYRGTAYTTGSSIGLSGRPMGIDSLGDDKRTLSQRKKDSAELSKAVVSKIDNLTPEMLKEAQERVRQTAGAEGVDPFTRGVMLLADNAGNMLASLTSPVIGFAAMYSNEAESMRSILTDAGVSEEMANKYALIYGVPSAMIEMTEQIGRVGSAFGKAKAVKGAKAGIGRTILRKGIAAAFNVSEEVAQNFIQNVVHNDAIREHNEKTGDNLELIDILDNTGSAITGSLSMSLVLESIGLSAKGARKAKTAWTLGDANRTRKQNSNEEIAEIIKNDPVLGETEESIKLATEMLETPTEATTEASNKHHLEEKEETDAIQEAEQEPIREEAEARKEVDEEVREPAEEGDLAAEPKKPIKVPEFVGIANAESKNLREALEFADQKLPEANKISQKKSVQDAIDKGVNLKAPLIVQQVLNKPRPLTTEESAGMLAYRAELANQIEEEIAARDQYEADGDKDAAEISDQELLSLYDQMDDLTKADKLAGTEEGRALAFRGAMMNRKTFELVNVMAKARTVKGDKLTDKQRKELEDKSKELKTTKDEVRKIALRREINQLIEKMRPTTKLNIIEQIWNLVKAIKLAFDQGHIGRQGGYALSNIKETNIIDITKKSFASFFKQETADKMELEIENWADRKRAEADGIHIVREGDSLGDVEYAVVTQGIAEKITDKMAPKKLVTRGIKASERSQRAGINLLRKNLYDGFMKRFPDTQAKERKAMASYFNSITGYGTWKLTGQFAKIKFVQLAMTSVRFTASRLQTATILFDPSKMKHKNLRNRMFQDAAWFYGIRAVLLHALASALSDDVVEVGSNPSHSSFGRLLIHMSNNKTLVIDPWAGVQRSWRVATAIAIGDRDYLTSLLEDIGKSAHVSLGSLRGVIEGKKYPNEDITRIEASVRAITPIPLESLVDGIFEKTPSGFIALGLYLDVIGISTYTVDTESLDGKKKFSDFVENRAKVKEKRKNALSN